MATDFARTAARQSPAPGAVAIMLARPATEGQGRDFEAALEAAAVAEAASHDERRNARCRLSYLLCEAANQLRQQRRGFDFAAELPYSRFALAEALGLPLCKVKRVLALLCLSGVVATDGRTLQVLDWRRLCGIAHVDPARLSIAAEDEDEEPILASPIEQDEAASRITASGEPACFV